MCLALMGIRVLLAEVHHDVRWGVNQQDVDTLKEVKINYRSIS